MCRQKIRKKAASSASSTADSRKGWYSNHSVRTNATGFSTESTLESKPDDSDGDNITMQTRYMSNGNGFSSRASTSARSVFSHASDTAPSHQLRLPVDLRSVTGSASNLHPPSVRDANVRSAAGGEFVVGVGRGGPSGVSASVGSRSASSDDMRQLVDSLLELKHRLEEYIQAGVHMERRSSVVVEPTTSSVSTSRSSPQYDALAAICDVSSRITDVTARYARSTLPSVGGGGGARHTVSSSGSVRLPPSSLIGPGYLIEHLSMLRPRIDRLARVLARSVRSGGRSRPSAAGISPLETVLANVGASVSLAMESMAEQCLDDPYHRAVLLPPPTGRTSSRPSSRHADGYGRVRRPPSARNGGVQRSVELSICFYPPVRNYVANLFHVVH